MAESTASASSGAPVAGDHCSRISNVNMSTLKSCASRLVAPVGSCGRNELMAEEKGEQKAKKGNEPAGIATTFIFRESIV